MILPLTKYKEVYHPTKSVRTVERMVKSGLVPENHIRIGGSIKPLLIEIVDDNGIKLHYYPFVVDFLLTKLISLQSAAQYCCENNLSMSTFCKLAKLK
jgi:hypothetical protein